MKRAIFSTAIILFTCLLFQGTAFSHDDDDNHKNQTQKVRASKDIKNSGEIVGVVNFCGAQGTNGSVVDLVGESFSAVLGVDGAFKLRYVPRGAYTLRVRIPNQPEHTQPVTVVKRRVTDVDGISICGDNDGDGITPDVLDLITGNDCNDNNALIFPGATEFCDGVDNDCDGNVDGDGCAICTDFDNDGFFAQDGCGTTIDCNDSDNTVRPNGAEICDGVDNNCDGSVDEGFDLNLDPNNCGECSNVCTSGQCGGGDCLNQCGNGIVETGNGETCDDGGESAACNSDCTAASCGDSVVNTTAGEECDDGNNTNGDGCQSNCILPPAFCINPNFPGTTPNGGTISCGSSNVGACQRGTRTCIDGIFTPCEGEVGPSFDICDGIDNDCDGQTDENGPSLCSDGNDCTSNFCTSSGCGSSFLELGTSCGSGLACDGSGSCKRAFGATCTSSSQCASGFCSINPFSSSGSCSF